MMRHKKIWIAYMAFLFIGLHFTLKAQDSTFVSLHTYQISTANNDAEESESGDINLSSSDLELVDEESNQVVGLRFNNIDLPRGTKISNAYLQFTVDEVTSGNCQLSISGELTANANPFQNVNHNISTRTHTTQIVQWAPSAWNTINASGEAQKSTDISAVIQEIIDLDGWNHNNALVLIISGEGTRTAISYEKNPEQSTKLVIETESPIVDVAVENIFVNELMAKNNSFPDEYGEEDDWIELFNANNFPVYLGGVYLSDDAGEPKKWRLLSPLTIEANGFALIWADKDVNQGAMHANFKLSASGESVVLSQVLDEQTIEIDRVDFDAQEADISFGRKQDGSEEWIYFGQPTPNSSNNDSKPVVETPSISLESGIFFNNQIIELTSAVPDARIFYTLDGNTPDTNSTLYTTPIEIDTTTSFKVIAYKKDFAPSKLAQRFYLFDYNAALPVFNISTDPPNLWDDSIGIYVEGTNGITHPNYDIPSNFFQPWERPGVVIMLEPDGSVAFSENVGIKLSGNDSKKFVQKSFGLHFRKKYGTDGVFYKVFENSELTEYQHLKLRNSGQDFLSMLMRDGLNHSLLQNVVDIDLMAYRPAVLYLNGEYWGLYGLRESLTDDYIDTHFDVDKKSIDLLTRDGEIIIEEGDDDDYWDLYHFIENNSMSDQDNYNAVANRIEIDELINYQIAEIYYANYDWPDNNQRMWRSDGTKWRWMMYDTDCSTNYDEWGEAYVSFNSLAFTTDPYSTSWPNNAVSSLIFRRLLQNEGFKQEFVQRTCTYLNLVFNPERVNYFVDSLINLMGSEIDREIERWSKDYPDFGEPGAACGGSKEEWESHISDYKDFFAQRPNYMMQHMKGKFNNYNTYLLRFNYNAQTKGTLYVNSNDFEIPFDYMAEYFGNYELKIKAVADLGYVFVKWLETGDTSATTSYIANTASVLTPVFVEGGAEGISDNPSGPNYQIKVFPNPASTESVQLGVSGFKKGEKLEVSIYNTMGQRIEFRLLNATNETLIIPVNIADWQNGIYFFNVQGKSVRKTVKLIIE